MWAHFNTFCQISLCVSLRGGGEGWKIFMRIAGREGEAAESWKRSPAALYSVLLPSCLSLATIDPKPILARYINGDIT